MVKSKFKSSPIELEKKNAQNIETSNKLKYKRQYKKDLIIKKLIKNYKELEMLYHHTVQKNTIHKTTIDQILNHTNNKPSHPDTPLAINNNAISTTKQHKTNTDSFEFNKYIDCNNDSDAKENANTTHIKNNIMPPYTSLPLSIVKQLESDVRNFGKKEAEKLSIVT